MFGRAELPDLPSVIFEVSTRCNLDCRYCYNIWKMPGRSPPPETTYAQAARTLRRFFRMARVGHITMTGGEPLLVKRLAELVLLCRMEGLGVSVITNGNAGSREDHRQLKDLGVDLFEVPFLAPGPEIHDALTRYTGSWLGARRSILELLEMGADVVAVVVATRANLPVLADTLGALAELGVKRVLLNRINLGGSGLAEPEALALGVAEVRDMFRTADRVAEACGLRITSGVCTPYCVVEPRRHAHIRSQSCDPDPRRRPLTLDCWGNLRTCNHSPVVIGNIYQESMQAILDSAYLRGWREIIPDHCAACVRSRECLGGCRAAAEQLGGNLHDPDPLLWPAERVVGRGSLK